LISVVGIGGVQALSDRNPSAEGRGTKTLGWDIRRNLCQNHYRTFIRSRIREIVYLMPIFIQRGRANVGGKIRAPCQPENTVAISALMKLLTMKLRSLRQKDRMGRSDLSLT
jgi:hypothetical protein